MSSIYTRTHAITSTIPSPNEMSHHLAKGGNGGERRSRKRSAKSFALPRHTVHTALGQQGQRTWSDVFFSDLFASITNAPITATM